MTTAERVLQKLNTLDSELQAVSATSEGIKKLEQAIKDQFNKISIFYEKAKKDNEEQFSEFQTFYNEFLFDGEREIDLLKEKFAEELEDLNKQKERHNVLIQALEQSKQQVEKNIELISAKTNEIDAALKLLCSTRLEVSGLEEKLTKAFSGLDTTISEKLSEYTNALGDITENITEQAERDLNAFRENAILMIGQLKDHVNTAIQDQNITALIIRNLNPEIVELENTINDRLTTIELDQSQFLELQQRRVDQLNALEGETTEANKALNTFRENAILKIGQLENKVNIAIQEDNLIILINRIIEQETLKLTGNINDRLTTIELDQSQFLELQQRRVDQLNALEGETTEANKALNTFRENAILKIGQLENKVNIAIQEDNLIILINRIIEQETLKLTGNINDRLIKIEQAQLQFLELQRGRVDQLTQGHNSVEQKFAVRDQKIDSFEKLIEQNFATQNNKIDDLEKKIKDLEKKKSIFGFG